MKAIIDAFSAFENILSEIKGMSMAEAAKVLRALDGLRQAIAAKDQALKSAATPIADAVKAQALPPTTPPQL